jgi:hypothetical protein
MMPVWHQSNYIEDDIIVGRHDSQRRNAIECSVHCRGENTKTYPKTPARMREFRTTYAADNFRRSCVKLQLATYLPQHAAMKKLNRKLKTNDPVAERN